MKQEALRYFPDTHLTVIAMLIFLAVFGLIVWNALRKANRNYYEKMSRIPLEQENVHES